MLDRETEDAAAARAEALRNADYASLTRHAATDNSRALVDEVLRLITTTEAETRKRQRVSRADAFRQAVEGFLGDLLAAKGEGWVYRPTGHSTFAAGDLSPRTVTAARDGLKKLDLLEEIPGRQWTGGDRIATRFKATPQLKQLAAQYGIQPSEAEKHFVLPLPLHPLLLKGASTWKGANKITGTMIEIKYTDKVTMLERMIIDLNDFLDGFDIRGGTHRGYFRMFNCGDDPSFAWDLGGRVYSQGKHNYQRLSGAERRKMTINGRPVCEIDVRASALTIFQSLGDEPLDFTNNPDLDPYALAGLPRDVVKAFITATFGNSQFPREWSKDAIEECKECGEYSIRQVRDVVKRAYPLLAKLRRDKAQPPLWARLMHLESEAVLGTMIALRARGIPSLSVHDSLIVPLNSEQRARDTLSKLYVAVAGATPHIVTRYREQ